MDKLICVLLFLVTLASSQFNIPFGRKTEPKVLRSICDYCSLGGRNPRENTYCQNFQSVSRSCRKVLYQGVDEETKKAILDIHNDYRRNIALGREAKLRYEASDMMELTWDEELARGAQMWANQCDFHHDSNDVCRFRVGQNLYSAGLYKGGSSEEKVKPKWVDACKSWYSEIDFFRQNPTRPSSSYLDTGHFTQMIWAKTQYVGCGFIVHEGYGGGNRYDSAYYVCNYGPAGNWLNKNVYSSGRACSKCPAGTACNQGLCRDQSVGTQETMNPINIWSTERSTTRRTTKRTTTKSSYTYPTQTKAPAKPKCDIKMLQKYLNACEA